MVDHPIGSRPANGVFAGSVGDVDVWWVPRFWVLRLLGIWTMMCYT